MNEERTIGEVDIVSVDGMSRIIAQAEEPCVSIFLPTHRAGRETRQDPLRFRNLVDRARAALLEHGTTRDADEILGGAAALLEDQQFWSHQADGLAVFACPGVHEAFRVARSLPEEASVGATFRIRPLVPLLTGDGHFFVLALSQAQVRLFEGTRSTIAARDLGATPTSMADALRYEDPEAQLQVRSVGTTGGGGRAGIFHGHGVGSEVDKQALERYFRAVDTGLQSTLGDDTHPIVLACVAYYVPIFRSVSKHPRVLEQCIEGNPDDISSTDLHSRAWDLVAPEFGADRERALARYAAAAGTGKTITDPAEIATVAAQGRVDTLLVALGPDGERNDEGDRVDRVDRAVLDVLRAGGSVFALAPGELPDRGDAVALLRF